MFCEKKRMNKVTSRQHRGEKPVLNLYFKKSFVVPVLFCSIFLNPPLPLSFLSISLCGIPLGITPHSTQMGSPRTSHAHVQSCMQIYTHTSIITRTPTCSSRAIQYTHMHTCTHTRQYALLSNPGHQLQ